MDNYQSDEQYGGHRAMVQRVEEATRLPAALTATLAYWGAEETTNWWLPEFERFATPRYAGGLQALLELGSISSLWLFYAAGVAATAAGRHTVLAEMMASSRHAPGRPQRQRLAGVLTPEQVYSGYSGGPEAFFEQTAPFLEDTLALGRHVIEDAWQTFEVIRLTGTVMADPRFLDTVAALEEADSEITRATMLVAQRSVDGTGAGDASEALALHQANARELFERMVGMVQGRRCYVLVSDLSTREGAGYRSPVAERLAEDVKAQGRPIRGCKRGSSRSGAYPRR